MEVCFHHKIKKNKDNCDILSHNSDFFSHNCKIQELWDINSQLREINKDFWLFLAIASLRLAILMTFLRIVRNKVAIASYKVQFWGKKSQLTILTFSYN